MRWERGNSQTTHPTKLGSMEILETVSAIAKAEETCGTCRKNWVGWGQGEFQIGKTQTLIGNISS